MQTRRQAIGALMYPVAASAFGFADSPQAMARAVAAASDLDVPNAPPREVARDEAFWFNLQQAFTVDRTIINLNNGGVCTAPAVVQNAVKRHLDEAYSCPPHVVWHVQEPRIDTIRKQLAEAWGVDVEEVAITRNATEGLDACLLGIALKPGDEILTTTHDYPRMITAIKQRERREGIVLKQFDLPVPLSHPAEVVRLFEQHITAKTRLILMCHMVNLTGQILPVKEVVAMGRARNIPVIVDGAHALAHFDFKISDLDCDYYGVSLHKWLFAPHGTGFLYVRRERIKDVWPLMAAEEKLNADIRKFEQTGMRPVAPYLAIAEALDFHKGIGAKNKEARLIYLRDYWLTRLLRNDRVKLLTNTSTGNACAMATIHVDGLDSAKLTNWLWDKHRILVCTVGTDKFNGVRVSPSVYTTLNELDRFCDAVERALRDGLPDN